MCVLVFFFFFQEEDGIRDAQESRGLGDVYKRQLLLTIDGRRMVVGLSRILKKTILIQKKRRLMSLKRRYKR